MADQPNIVLVGFMGTGKTTVGKLLAERLKMEFLDMDDIIENETGKKISQIFKDDGEPYFRELERKLVIRLATKKGLVIATGGGIVLDRQNIKDFSATGRVICLSADPELILQRVGTENHRPLLDNKQKAQKILDILATRQSLYDAIAIQIDTSHLKPEQVVNQIIERI